MLINLVKYTDMKTPSGARLYQEHSSAPDTHAGNVQFALGNEPLSGGVLLGEPELSGQDDAVLLL